MIVILRVLLALLILIKGFVLFSFKTAYEDKVLDGLTLKILSADPKFYAAKVLYRCLMGAFEAIEKRYVSIILSISIY